MKAILAAALLLLSYNCFAQLKETGTVTKLSSGITYIPLVSHINEKEPHATVYFYRPYLNPLTAPIRSMPFTINDSLIYELKANRMISFFVTPGKYKISADSKDKTSMYLTLKEGKEYFFAGEMPIGIYTSLSLTAIRSDIARKETGLPSVANVDSSKTVATIAGAVVSNVDSVHSSDSIPASFPGGQQAWTNYLLANLNAKLGKKYIHIERSDTTATQTALVSFVIDVHGNVGQVKVLNPAEVHEKLADEAIRVVSNSPQWKPASINSRNVIYREKQNITFSTSWK